MTKNEFWHAGIAQIKKKIDDPMEFKKKASENKNESNAHTSIGIINKPSPGNNSNTVHMMC